MIAVCSLIASLVFQHMPSWRNQFNLAEIMEGDPLKLNLHARVSLSSLTRKHPNEIGVGEDDVKDGVAVAHR